MILRLAAAIVLASLVVLVLMMAATPCPCPCNRGGSNVEKVRVVLKDGLADGKVIEGDRVDVFAEGVLVGSAKAADIEYFGNDPAEVTVPGEGGDTDPNAVGKSDPGADSTTGGQ